MESDDPIDPDEREKSGTCTPLDVSSIDLSHGLPDVLVAEPPPIQISSDGSQVLTNLIKELSVPQRIKLAMFGNKEARTLLIRDSNRQIPLFVLENARITSEEIADFARNPNLDESVFRAISGKSQWMKSPTVRMNLVTNPRVPIDVSMRWLKYLQDRDLRTIARSKNVPNAVATQARKILEHRSDKGD